MTEILTVTSGKGGVGKTSISLNTALALALKGHRVCLFDADLGLANVNILTGIYPEHDLGSVILGEKRLDEIIIRNYHGVDIVPGSNGVQKMADLSDGQAEELIRAFKTLGNYDYLIFDTSAGISSQVMSFCLASNEIILVVTREPTSLTDGYAMLKALDKRKYRFPVKVLFNNVPRVESARTAYGKLKKTVDRYLGVELSPLGVIISDPEVSSAVTSQTPFYIKSPNARASRCIRGICTKLVEKKEAFNNVPMEVFWERCLTFFRHTLSDRTEKDGRDPAAPLSGTGKKDRALKAIESRLNALTDEIKELKHLFLQQGRSSREAEAGPNMVPWADTRRISGDDAATVEPLHAHRRKKKKTKIKPIVRGRLRTPTPEELNNWDEFNSPVVNRSHLPQSCSA